MVTNDALTRTALVVGIALLLILAVNASLGTAETLSGNQPAQGSLAGILGQASAGVAVLSSAPRQLSTDGRGSVTLSPDEVQIGIGALTQGLTAQAASDANAKMIGAVIAQLNSMGVANTSISTTAFSITPLYNYTKSGAPVVYGYQAQHSLLVTQESSDVNALGTRVSQIIDASVSAGANQVNQVYFTLSDQTLKQTDNQALNLAIQDASSRASLMASALNVTLSGVVSVSSSTQSLPSVEYRSTAPSSSVGGVVSTTVLPGNFTVSASVQVSYAIK